MPNKISFRRLSRHVFTTSDERFIGGLSLLATVGLLLGIAKATIFDGGFVALDSIAPAPVQFEVNVNEAPWTELAQLPRIGPVLAGRLVADRTENGPFRSVEDLQRVHGVGPQTAERMAPSLTNFVQPKERGL